jgi:hypothetical protein
MHWDRLRGRFAPVQYPSGTLSLWKTGAVWTGAQSQEKVSKDSLFGGYARRCGGICWSLHAHDEGGVSSALRSTPLEKGVRMRKSALLLASVLTVLALSSGVALAEIKIGTDNPETIVGTNSADHITGKGGDDSLRGKAGNDVYHFDIDMRNDTLRETAFVGANKLPGGTDTLSFSQVGNTRVSIHMIPQWAAKGWNAPFLFGCTIPAGAGCTLDMGTSPVENAVGGLGNDTLHGGSAKNTYKGGPGGDDLFFDYGGNDGSAVNDPALPDLRASDDTYKGFTSGNDLVADYGGTADKLNLRPLESSDVYFDAFDEDGSGSNDSLRIVINDSTRVDVIGHFAPVPNRALENGRMEQIIFSDKVVTTAG